MARADALDSIAHVRELESIPPPPAWTTGIEGTTRVETIGDNSGVLAVVACVFVLMLLSYRSSARLFSKLWHDMWGLRKRENVFDEHTSNETRTLAIMALQWCVCIGLLLYSAISTLGAAPLPATEAFPDTAKLIALAAAYYVVQLGAYALLGYTFSDNFGRMALLQGFTASQSMVSFMLLVPALVSIFYPVAATVAIGVAAGLYLLARIAFISKGFRIFYTNFGSLFYFILYLCSLEIIPLIIVYDIALLIVHSPSPLTY